MLRRTRRIATFGLLTAGLLTLLLACSKKPAATEGASPSQTVSTESKTGSGMGREFVADIVMKTPAGDMKGTIYVGDDKTRMDLPQSSVITRLDKQVVWMLMPMTKMYLEQPIDAESLAAGRSEIPGEVSRVEMGEEMVADRKAKKYQVEYTLQDTPQTVLQWIDVETNIPTRVSAVDGSWMMEYHNINLGKQPDDLFEIPAGYRNMEMPSR